MIVPFGLITLLLLYTANDAVRLLMALHRYRAAQLLRYAQPYSDPLRDDHIPSVSVCIPARNEAHAMTECLEAVLASDYPKLEVLVLDDSSEDETPNLVRAFARSGVRFIAGSPIPRGWIGKNHALDTLIRSASGTYVVVLDVDTHIAPDTIRTLVAYAQKNVKNMVSVLPMRRDNYRFSVIFSTLRHYKELINARPNAPAVFSSLWMVSRQDVLAADGLVPYKSLARPEHHLAGRYSRASSYQGFISTPRLGVSQLKKHSSQIESSIRINAAPSAAHVLYPNLRNLFLIAFLVLPLAWILFDDGANVWTAVIALGAALLIRCTLYGIYTLHVWKPGGWLGFFVWPVVAVQEIVVTAISHIRHSRGTVTWKGRNISGVLTESE